MTGFIQENWGSLLVGAILLAVVALIVVKLVRDRKSGRHSCGGDCGSCGACRECSGSRTNRQDSKGCK